MRSNLLAATAIGTLVLTLFSASGSAQTPGLQISVEPLIVQFALAPGGQASAPVTIRNVGTEPALILANQIDWRTTLDGAVKTERPGVEGTTSLDQYLRLSATEFVLAPGESRRATLSLTLPPAFSSTPRDYHGGYFVRATTAGSPTTRSFGVGANILAYQTTGPAQRHLAVTSLKVVDVADGVQLVARLKNDGRNFVRPQIRTTVSQAGRIVQQRDDSTPAIFAGEPRLYSRTLSNLTPGAYELALTVDYGAETVIEGTTTFRVR